MSFGSTLPDPASTLSGGSNLAGGLASLYAPSRWTPPEDSSAKPELIKGVGWRIRKKDENGNDTFRPLDPTELKNYGLTSQSDELERQRYEKEQGEKTKAGIAAAAARNKGRELGVLEGEAATNRYSAETGRITAQNTAQFQSDQLEALRTKQQNEYDLELKRLRQEGDITGAALLQRQHEFKITTEQQNEQMRENNKLQGRKLDLEDQHFQQQMAQDRRASRRAQVLGSLTLVAQSLSRL